MASNSDFIPDDVYVELEYSHPDLEDYCIKAVPFRTPAAVHKANMLQYPESKLIKIGISDGFATWVDEKVSEREHTDRNKWWEKIQALLPQKPLPSETTANPYESGVKLYPLEVTVSNDTEAVQMKVLENLAEALKPPKSYAEAFERSEQKAIEKSKAENPDVFELAATLSDKINALNTAVDKAKTDKAGAGLTMIPFYSILEIGKIFVDGLRYGRDNWKKAVNDPEWQDERLDHALLHLAKWKEGDHTENHLAKVAWFCVVQLELERLERDNTSS